VQDVLLTVHAIRHTYDPGPSVRAVACRQSPTDAIIDRLRRHIRARSREIEPVGPNMKPFRLMRRTSSSKTHPADSAALHAAIAYAGARSTPGHQPAQAQGNVLKEAALASGRSVSALKVADAPGHQVAAEATATVERNARDRKPKNS